MKEKYEFPSFDHYLQFKISENTNITFSEIDAAGKLNKMFGPVYVSYTNNQLISVKAVYYNLFGLLVVVDDTIADLFPFEKMSPIHIESTYEKYNDSWHNYIVISKARLATDRTADVYLLEQYYKHFNEYLDEQENRAFLEAEDICKKMYKLAEVKRAIANYIELLNDPSIKNILGYEDYAYSTILWMGDCLAKAFFERYEKYSDIKGLHIEQKIIQKFAQLKSAFERRYDIPHHLNALVLHLLIKRGLSDTCSERLQKALDNTYLLDDPEYIAVICMENGLLLSYSSDEVSEVCWYILHRTGNIRINLTDCYWKAITLAERKKREEQDRAFEDKLFGNKDDEQLHSIHYTHKLTEIDRMTGIEFEQYIASLFQMLGYQVQLTKASHDQGIDVIADKIGTRIGIQTKCYSNSVGNSAIQEAVAGKAYYHLDKVFVITNNYFTEDAKNLAKVNQVVLWDRNTFISEKIVY